MEYFTVTPSGDDVTPIIVMFDKENWILYATKFGKGNLDDLLGVIQENVFTFMPRENISLLDFEFIVLNSEHKGFTITDEMQYKLGTS